MTFVKIYCVYACIFSKALSKNHSQTRTLDLKKTMNPLKNEPVRKTEPQGLKPLPVISCHMKDNVKVIHFHVKSRGVQGPVFIQTTFEKYTTNFYLENSEFGIKMTIVNLYHLLVWNFSAYLHIFKQLRFFNATTRLIFTKLLSVSERLIKIKTRLQ